MALSSTEVRSRGFVYDRVTGRLSVTTALSGATWQAGFLRDSDGRLVVKNV